MPVFHAKTPLDRAFEISLLLKGFDGLLETVSGTLFLFVKPDTVLRLAHHTVGYHPDDFLSQHILTSAENFSRGAAIFAGLYLLSHGVVKLVLVVEILLEHLWAYVGLIVVTAIFILYQLYHIIFQHPTFSFIALTLFDFVVIYLTNKEYGKQKEHFANRHKLAEE
jgi:uncharacterized membrane protein